MKSGRHLMIAKMIHREIDRTLQVIIYRILTAVRIEDHFIQESNITGFGYVLVDGREQPKGIIRAISRMSGLSYIRFIIRSILMSGIMIEFDKRKSGAVINLSR